MFDFDLTFFDKFVFHGVRPEFMSIEYLINAFTYNENLEFDNDKINIWYVRDDIGCNDFVNSCITHKLLLPHFFPEHLLI